jgi:polyisoprenoid-binding protein YceI
MRMAALSALFAFSVVPVVAHASEWQLDPTHTNVGFAVKHMMVTDVHGAFDTYQGTIEVDDKDVTKSKINVDIDAASVNTKAQKRDDHLRSADFFDVQKFPKLTFTSTKIVEKKKDHLAVSGDLTIHGITKPVVLDVVLSDEWTDPKEWGGNTHRGAKATTTINRKDFGLLWQKQLDKGGAVVGDLVTIEINAELLKKNPAKKA